MAKKGLKLKVEGREPNDLCICRSGKKYKRCCGIHTKGTGKFPRESANRQAKLDRNEAIKITTSAFQRKMLAEMMRNPKINQTHRIGE